MSSTGRRIREVRKNLALTQGDFAQRLGVSQTTISRWESGAQEPDYDSLRKIGEAGGLDPNRFAYNLDETHDLGSSILGRRVEIVGAIKENAWVDSIRWEASDRVETVFPMDVSNEYRVEAYIISDNSCDPTFPIKTIVFVALFDKEFIPQSGDICLYAQRDERDLVEITLKEYRYFGDGTIILSTVRPQSNIIVFEKPAIEAALRRPSKFAGLGLYGLVIASFVDVNSGRLAIERLRAGDD